MDLDTFVEHAGHYAWLERRIGKQALLRALDGDESLHHEDAEDVADFLDALAPDLSDETQTEALAEALRKGA